MKTKLIVCHARPGDAYEIQTNETPHRLVAALFHNSNDPSRLSMEEAAVYASIFAAAPELLRTEKQLVDIIRSAGVLEAIDQITEILPQLNEAEAAIAKAESQE